MHNVDPTMIITKTIEATTNMAANLPAGNFLSGGVGSVRLTLLVGGVVVIDGVVGVVVVGHAPESPKQYRSAHPVVCCKQ